MVYLGSNAERSIDDVHMTRLGMYFLAMNGDPDKPVIAAAPSVYAGESVMPYRDVADKRLSHFTELQELSRPIRSFRDS